jgi:hypothetical protein
MLESMGDAAGRGGGADALVTFNEREMLPDSIGTFAVRTS